ncbi:MAG: metallopeptidase TldD-related protein [Thermoplasmata archaeon]
MEIVDRLYEKLSRSGFDEIILSHSQSSVRQVRFSGSRKDMDAEWDESSLGVFVSRGKRILALVINDMSVVDTIPEKLVSMISRMPENPLFNGIYNRKVDSSSVPARRLSEIDIVDRSMTMINGAMDNGAEKCAGLIYRKEGIENIRTNYNSVEFPAGGYEMLIRSFRNGDSGQEASHAGMMSDLHESDFARLGEESARNATLKTSYSDGVEGKIDVIMSPYVIGNILTYSSEFFSAESVISGLSFLQDRIGQPVASESVTLIDDPLDFTGIGGRMFDDECVPTRRNMMIDHGVLKTYFHSFSTSKNFKTETTGNAGILMPNSWQLKLSGGERKIDEMIASMKRGLFIQNTWYTRFQDYRNGVFSTVPRDGIYLVENGEITTRWKGVRISDSVPNILKSISETSMETRKVKWWQEIAATEMPYALVNDVNITKAF